MDILIQNTGATPYFMTLTTKSQGHSGVAGRITLEADNQTTKLSEEIYEKKIKNNPFFQRLIENGTLIVLNDVGVKPHQAVAEAQASRELGYARYKNLVVNIEHNGGAGNSELAPYLDREGLPKLDLVRSSLGQVDPQKISEYRSRFIAERNSGFGGIVLPSGKKASSVSTDTETVEKQIAQEAPAVAPEAQSPAQALQKAEVADRARLETMSRDELMEYAKQNEISFSNRITSERLVNKILEEQDLA